jgi:hypothetical protein
MEKVYGEASPDLSDRANRNQFISDFLQQSLWGNQSDLSLHQHANQIKGISPLLSSVDMHESLNVHHSEKTDSLIINDLNRVVKYLASKDNARVDIILDNSGFELFVDLIFADFLIKSGICKMVVFHAKEYPYFVSDVVCLLF